MPVFLQGDDHQYRIERINDGKVTFRYKNREKTTENAQRFPGLNSSAG